MGNSYKALATQILADGKVVNANERAMSTVRIESQCKCVHRDSNGGFALIVPSGGNVKKSKYTGAPLYTCKLCQKEIDVSNISEEEFERALNVIDRVCDLSKMHLNFSTEADQDLWKSVSKQQFKLLTIIEKCYRTIRKGGRKKKKNNNNPMSGLIEVSR